MFKRKSKTPAKPFSEVIKETALLIVENGYVYYGGTVPETAMAHQTVEARLKITLEHFALVASKDWVYQTKANMERILASRAMASEITAELYERKRDEVRGRLMVKAMNADLTETPLFLSLAANDVSLDELNRLEALIASVENGNLSRLTYQDKVSIGAIDEKR